VKQLNASKFIVDSVTRLCCVYGNWNRTGACWYWWFVGFYI